MDWNGIRITFFYSLVYVIDDCPVFRYVYHLDRGMSYPLSLYYIILSRYDYIVYLRFKGFQRRQ